VDIGPQELILILLIVALFFGANKIPQLAKGMGQAVTEFRRGVRGEEDPKPSDEDTASS
jgi:sec-independent protein translocase protein TatA